MTNKTATSKSDYLKRYLDQKPKKKKKSSEKTQLSKVKILDDDIDVGGNCAPLSGGGGGGADELDLGEDAPVVADIIDERPVEVREMENYNAGKKWRKIDRNDDVSSPVVSDQGSLRRPSHDDGGRTRHDSSDLSPDRGQQRHDSDQSPGDRGGDANKSDLNKSRGHVKSDLNGDKGRQRHDSDQSPDRGQGHESDLSPDRGHQRYDSDQSPDRGQGRDRSAPRTSGDGWPSRRRRGAGQGRHDDDGRHSETVFRNRSGVRRDLKQERLEKKSAEIAQAEKDAKFMEWGRGVAQVEAAKTKHEEELLEMSKPLARYRDDLDLDAMLRDRVRDGDPMLAFIRAKKSDADRSAGVEQKPKYKGPAPANRFNILPGYRWDGVDRSNGFEKKLFKSKAERKAFITESYKWSTEDM